jgi:hypothetical protein
LALCAAHLVASPLQRQPFLGKPFVLGALQILDGFQLTFAHAGLGVFFRPSGIALTFSREIPNGWSNRPLPDGRVVS